MLKSIAAFSNLIRSLVALAVTLMLGWGGWVFYRTYNAHELALQALQDKDRELQAKTDKIQKLSEEVESQKIEIQRLETAMKLLKVDHRVAQIVVTDQQGSAEAEDLKTTFKFVEVDEQGRPLEQARTFTIGGDVVYIDTWVVKFSDEYVEKSDPMRSTSICLFRRIFGEFQEPSEGFVLDPVGSRPAAYSPGGDMSDFEQQLWSQFWDYANNPAKAEAAGVRAAHGEAPSIKLLKDKRYRLELRASGGLTIRSED